MNEWKLSNCQLACENTCIHIYNLQKSDTANISRQNVSWLNWMLTYHPKKQQRQHDLTRHSPEPKSQICWPNVMIKFQQENTKTNNHKKLKSKKPKKHSDTCIPHLNGSKIFWEIWV